MQPVKVKSSFRPSFSFDMAQDQVRVRAKKRAARFVGGLDVLAASRRTRAQAGAIARDARGSAEGLGEGLGSHVATEREVVKHSHLNFPPSMISWILAMKSWNREITTPLS